MNPNLKSGLVDRGLEKQLAPRNAKDLYGNRHIMSGKQICVANISYRKTADQRLAHVCTVALNSPCSETPARRAAMIWEV